MTTAEIPVVCPSCGGTAKVVTRKITSKPAQPMLVCKCGATSFDRTEINKLVIAAQEEGML